VKLDTGIILLSLLLLFAGLLLMLTVTRTCWFALIAAMTLLGVSSCGMNRGSSCGPDPAHGCNGGVPSGELPRRTFERHVVGYVAGGSTGGPLCVSAAALGGALTCTGIYYSPGQAVLLIPRGGSKVEGDLSKEGNNHVWTNLKVVQ